MTYRSDIPLLTHVPFICEKILMSITASTHKDVDNLQRKLKEAEKALSRVKACMVFVRKNWSDLTEMKQAWENDDDIYAGQIWNELDYKDQSALILAPTKGGILTTDQIKRLKGYWTVTIEDLEA